MELSKKEKRNVAISGQVKINTGMAQLNLSVYEDEAYWPCDFRILFNNANIHIKALIKALEQFHNQQVGKYER